MEENLKYFVDNDCLICEDSHLFTQLVEKFYLDIIKFQQKYSDLPKIILNQRQPVYFLAGFIAACQAKSPIFLCNPDWGKQEWHEVFDLVKPDIIWGTEGKVVEVFSSLNAYINNPKIPFTTAGCVRIMCDSPHIMIPTGGSGGKIKFAVHTWDTLTASVRGFQEYFQIYKINSFCMLPLYHVSGLMQFMRCFITGGKLIISSFKTLESGEKSHLQNFNIKNLNFFISLVPTQLERLLQKSDLTEWLRKFQTVLLGGAPAWDELLQKARFNHLRLAPTYGMTETASQIATLKPEDFLRGKIGCGKVLPHAKVQIISEKKDFIQTNQVGRINIQAKSLALGYYPLNNTIQTDLQIDDLACFDEQGYLNIVGRNSDKIITGGENVYPTEIETAIRATEMVADVCVIGLDDKHWGQVVTAIYVPKKSDILNLEIQALLKEKLSNYKIPKIWISVASLPRNSQGKINRQQLYEIAFARA
ncbi:MAG: 2-succinylbenzoate--CoA ligase [Cyanobacteria bacterium P01_D01_bin.50]